MIKELSIPKGRIPVLIGKNGETKRLIESATKTKIKITGFVSINGDAIGIVSAENIVKAVGRGFSPENAMQLLDEEKTLHIINLPAAKAPLRRIKSRLIGTPGRARRNIERFTHTSISVYGKTVSIIGSYEGVEKAGVAIEKLIAGARHKSVYKDIRRHPSLNKNHQPGDF